MKDLAYVNLEPNNGGIILDISEGGLCFNSPPPFNALKRFVCGFLPQ